MSNYSWRSGGVALLVLFALLMACARSGGSSVDSARTDPVVVSGAATSAASDTAPRVGSSEKPPTDKVVGSAGRASSAGGARVTGGPERKPTPPRSSGCGGSFVNVTVKASALAGTSLAEVASEVLAPVRAEVGAPSLSPAIRAFRVAVRDPLGADRIVRQLRSSPKVEAAERDGCEKMIERDGEP